jgi:hypothetical protein
MIERFSAEGEILSLLLKENPSVVAHCTYRGSVNFETTKYINKI